MTTDIAAVGIILVVLVALLLAISDGHDIFPPS